MFRLQANKTFLGHPRPCQYLIRSPFRSLVECYTTVWDLLDTSVEVGLDPLTLVEPLTPCTQLIYQQGNVVIILNCCLSFQMAWNGKETDRDTQD